MTDEPDPPRKFYGFKAREFERANEVGPSAAPRSPALQADPGIVPVSQGKIDVNELIRLGAGKGSQLGSNAVANRANEIHAMLRDNLARDQAAGQYDLGTLDDSKRRKRIRNYWIAIAAVNVPLGLLAWWIGPGGNPFFFAGTIGGIGCFTASLTWRTFFLRTRY